VVDYDPAWPGIFAAEVARLSRFFPTGASRAVEHVGSTAVPGLAGKPIVDILVVVEDPQLVAERVAPAMEAAGYDFFLRPAFGDSGPRYPWFIGRDEAGRRVSHIHVARAGDASWSDRILFRDRLRRHPDVARAYGELKRELAARYPGEREAYTLAKTEFIVRELAAAKDEGADRCHGEGV
jgi:GrpB-like predicted nucleotidyltransferase (UPF0157 family)